MTASSVRSEILENFLAHLDEVVDRCAREILTIQSYRRAGDAMGEDVRGAVRGNVESLTYVVREGRRHGEEGLDRIAKVGARRAQAGIPLDDVLQAYRIVSRVCWDVLAEQCRRVEGDPLEATIEIAEALMRYTDILSTTVADSYAQAQRAIVREQEGARREFLADLLYGTESDAEEILERAHTYGYDLSLSYIALVGIGGGGDEGRESLVAAAVARAVPDATADPIILEKADQTIALVPADSSLDTGVVPEKLVTELEEDWRFGMGGPEPGLEGIRRAYLEAKEALEIGVALGFQTQVFRFDDLLAYHFLRNDPNLVDRFVSQTLGPLIEYDTRRRGELVNTLEAFFDCDGSVKLAGESLFAHPHTVTYRLKQLERLTGWSLKSPEEKLRMQLALRAHRLAQARSESHRL
jgi:DNA-binding PucR family transcriptional regulator